MVPMNVMASGKPGDWVSWLCVCRSPGASLVIAPMSGWQPDAG